MAEKAKGGYNHGSSDARHFAKVDTPSMMSGPVGANHHADNENVKIDSLVDYYRVVKEFLKNN